MTFLRVMLYIDIFFLAVLAVLALPRIIYMTAGLFVKKSFPQAEKKHKFCVLIPARNEEAVVGNLIDSIKKQDYPQELIDIFVVADDCFDATAERARAAGATVFERSPAAGEKGRKGYALDYGLKRIFAEYPDAGYHAVMFFDADNVLSTRYFAEMNNAYAAGKRICSSYRNSKNWGANWIASGYGIRFMSECRYMHASRTALGCGTNISGTGFYVAYDLLHEAGGWKYGLLCEDIEFSVDMAVKGEDIAYNHDAVLYDEQPESFRASWKQRMRWARGFYECLWHYGKPLGRSLFKKNGYRCFDMLTMLLPQVIFLVWFFSSLLLRFGAGAVLYVTSPPASFWQSPLFLAAVLPLAAVVAFYFLSAWFNALCVVVSQRKQIKATFWQKLRGVLCYPVYFLTFIPIGIAALFRTVKWERIEHTKAVAIEELEN